MKYLGRLGGRPIPAPLPGWRFGQPRAARFSYFVRLVVWKLASLARSTARVRTPWLYDTTVEVLLASDLGRCTWVAGCFEPNELTVLARVVRTGDTVVDVGANIGLYTLAAARLVGTEGTVLAIEPSAREHSALLQNLALNSLGRVRVDDRAVGSEAGRRVLHLADAQHAGQNTLGSVVYGGVSVVGSEEVAVASLDQIIAEAGLTAVSVLKIDVEGAEHEVLRGALRCLDELRPVILMELQEPSLAALGSSVAEVLGLLEAHGYRVLAYGSADSPMLVPLSAANRAEAQDVVAVPVERSLPV